MDNTGGVESLGKRARKDGGRLTFTDRGRYNGVVQRSASVDENAGTPPEASGEDADSREAERNRLAGEWGLTGTRSRTPGRARIRPI